MDQITLNDRNKRLIKVIVISVMCLLVIWSSFTTVSAGHRGIVLRFGAVNRVLDSGIHLKVPFVESVKSISVQTQKEQVETDAASQDLQTVKAIVAVNYNVDSSKVLELWNSIGIDYKVRVIDPAIQEAVKAATAKYTAEQLITQRPKVKEDIRFALATILAPKDIQVSDVSITNFDFSPSFNAAIEAKVTAEQQALQAKNKLDQIKYEAEQTVATAKAQAESIKLQSEAANNDKYVALKALEVQEAAIKKWNGVLPTSFVPGSAVPFINLTK